MDDHAVALLLARAAGDELLRVRDRLHAADAGAVEVKAAGDAAAQQVLAAGLRQHRPDDAVLSEEAADDPPRLGSRPGLGRRPARRHPRVRRARTHRLGRARRAVGRAATLVAGAVTLPAAGLAYATAEPAAVPPAPAGPLRLAVSRTRPPAFVRRWPSGSAPSVVPMGSAGVKATSVLRGEADVYLHAGGQYEWDSAAPVAVARPPACTPAGSTAARCGTTAPTPSCPTCWSAVPSTPVPCSTRWPRDRQAAP